MLFRVHPPEYPCREDNFRPCLLPISKGPETIDHVLETTSIAWLRLAWRYFADLSGCGAAVRRAFRAVPESHKWWGWRPLVTSSIATNGGIGDH